MLRKLIYPVLVFVFMALTWWLLGRIPGEYHDLIPGLLSLPTIVLIELLERWLPRKKEWRENFGDWGSDLIHTLILFPIVLRLAQVTASALALQSFSIFSEGTPLWVEFPVMLVAAELFFYTIHRLAHEVPLLWRFHRIHHGASRVYWANAARFHPIDLWITMSIYFFPFYLIQLPSDAMVLLFAANVVTGLLEHANIDFDAGWLNRIFNTAQLHRWHHSTLMKEANRNFGKVLSVWDVMLGTWLFEPGTEVGEVGLSAGEAEVPQTIIAQTFTPFGGGA